MNMIIFVLLVSKNGVLGWVGERGELPVRLRFLKVKAHAFSCVDLNHWDRSQWPRTGSPPMILDGLTGIY